MNTGIAILKAIDALGPECGTVQIRQWLEEEYTNRFVTIGLLWSHLDLLERHGLIVTEQRPGGPERGNRPKRVCWLTDSGLAALKEIEPK